MTHPAPRPDPGAPRAQVAPAIQKLAAARLGRAFMPLAALHLLLGLWLVWRWLQILELARLAASMTLALPGEGPEVG